MVVTFHMGFTVLRVYRKQHHSLFASFTPNKISGIGQMNDTRRVKLLEKGILDLQVFGLRNEDVKRIFVKLDTPSRSQPCRKCRKLEGKEDVIAKLSSIFQVNEVRMYGNIGIGESSMLHLTLLPLSVTILNLSHCDISVLGTRRVCDFLKDNHTLTSLNLEGNHMNDEGAKYVGEMLATNKTLENFRMSATVRSKGYRYIGEGLRRNETLKKFGNFRLNDPDTVSYFASVLQNGSSLEYFCLFPWDYGTEEEAAIAEWESVVSQSESLKYLGCDFVTSSKWNRIQYWLELNRSQARKVTREGDIHEFMNSLSESAEYRQPSVVYYLLRNNVDYLQLIHAGRNRRKGKRNSQRMMCSIQRRGNRDG
jgi:hypothetical protein